MAEEGPSSREFLFLHMVSMFQAAAMQQMGKIMNPVTGKITKDLEQAKVSIDILDVLKERTKGNLTGLEGEFLEKVLFELHMNYVDEVKASKEEKETPKEEESAEEKKEAAQAEATEKSPDEDKGAGKEEAGKTRTKRKKKGT